jgi:phosphoglycerate dehydrogenase-like enzyme
VSAASLLVRPALGTDLPGGRRRRTSLPESAALALQRKTIGGAALDVYDQEPLPADHPLRHTERTLLLAHCGWPTDAGSPINVENAQTGLRPA